MIKIHCFKDCVSALEYFFLVGGGVLWVQENKYTKHTILLVDVGLLWVCWLSHHYFHTAKEIHIQGLFFVFFGSHVSLGLFHAHNANLPHSESLHVFYWRMSHYHLFKALAVSFCILTGRPTRTGREAPGLGPALGPDIGLVAGGWPGMFRRLNFGTTATLTLRLGKAWTDGRPWKSQRESTTFSSVLNRYVWDGWVAVVYLKAGKGQDCA